MGEVRLFHEQTRSALRETAGEMLIVMPVGATEHHASWQSFDGYTDSPDRGDPEHGRRYLAAVTGAVANALLEFYRGSQT